MQFLMHKIDYEIVQTKSDKRYHNEWNILTSDLQILTLEGPNAIPNVIIGCCEDKTNGITDIFIPLEFFFT